MPNKNVWYMVSLSLQYKLATIEAPQVTLYSLMATCIAIKLKQVDKPYLIENYILIKYYRDLYHENMIVELYRSFFAKEILIF